ncbi:MAG: rhomboid family intramembrane serine protease [Candidatus Methylacidiphilales bacterium]|nr:rhomboid family intramembrane serine protease [Candidatus Methylacidiphilales bacterium]
MSYHRWPSSSGSSEPLTYIRGVALDVTTLITLVHVAGMLVVALLLTTKQTAWVEAAKFDTSFLASGRPWSLFTYAFCHDITRESIFFAVQMLMFFWFGREVERFIGRSAFAWFYALLCLMPPVGLAALNLFVPLHASGFIEGSSTIHLAVFVGFAIIYPNAQLLFGILAKWMAVVFLAISTLVYLVGHDWFLLLYFWLTMSVAWSMLRFAGVGGGFGWWNAVESWRMQRRERKIDQRRARNQLERAVEEQTVDEILEKISRNGMASLNERDRAVLERTRQKLVRRDAGQD